MAATKSFFFSTSSCACAALVQMETASLTLGNIPLTFLTRSSLFRINSSRDVGEPLAVPLLLTPTKISPLKLFFNATALSLIFSGCSLGSQNKIPYVLSKESFRKIGSCVDPSAGKTPHSVGHGMDTCRKYAFFTLTSSLNAA